jgi:hypothetical protein
MRFINERSRGFLKEGFIFVQNALKSLDPLRVFLQNERFFAPVARLVS